MNKDKQKDFARRVSQANKTELVVITYDIIIEEIEDAGRFFEEADVPGARISLKKAQQFLGQLMSSLDFSYGISRQLMSLYEYVQRILVACDISGSNKDLDSAENVLKGLRSGFDKIAVEDTTGAVMENTQSVYAGLTYGRNSLNETNMSDGSNRGFLA